MKLKFLELAADERRRYVEQAAIQRNVSAVILEKDFWVCWLLGVLFCSKFAGSLVFKGGTSLAKVFGVIDRFSEDIDLSLSPEFLGLPEAGASRHQANKWMKNAEAACGTAVEKQIAPTMEAAVAAVLGKGAGNWFEFVTEPITNSPVLLFHYPSTQPHGFEYLRRSVKLEFGSLTDQQPVGRHPVRPLVAETPSGGHSPIGGARSSHWKWSEAFGKKRRSCTPSTIDRRSGRHPIGSLAITPTRRRWPGILRRLERSASMIYGNGSSRGRGSFSGVHGPDMTLRNRGRSA